MSNVEKDGLVNVEFLNLGTMKGLKSQGVFMCEIECDEPEKKTSFRFVIACDRDCDLKPKTAVWCIGDPDSYKTCADAIKARDSNGSGDEGTGSGDEGTGSGDEGTGSGDEGTGSGDEGTGSGDEGTGSGDEGTGSGDE